MNKYKSVISGLLFFNTLINCNKNEYFDQNYNFPRESLEGKIIDLETGYIDFSKTIESYKNEIKTSKDIDKENYETIKDHQQKKQNIEAKYLDYYDKKNLYEKMNNLKWIVHLNTILDNKDRDIAYVKEDDRFINPPEKSKNEKAIKNLKKKDKEILDAILKNNILNAKREFVEYKLKNLKEKNYFELAIREYQEEIIKCLKSLKNLAPKTYTLKNGKTYSLEENQIQDILDNIERNKDNKDILSKILIKAIYQIELWIGKEDHFYNNQF